jgi:hypothetical protein
MPGPSWRENRMILKTRPVVVCEGSAEIESRKSKKATHGSEG